MYRKYRISKGLRVGLSASSNTTERDNSSNMTSLRTNSSPRTYECTGLSSEDASYGDVSPISKRIFYEPFSNKRNTPERDSDNISVIWSLRGFSVAKVRLLNSYVNILLPFVPFGIIAGAGSWDPTTVFVLNFFAIAPLSVVLSFATEEISSTVRQTLGGLLNATFGNAIKLIVTSAALRSGQIRIVQLSMLGSILTSNLLVLGCCFLAGGTYNTRTGTASGTEQVFNSAAASTMSSMMTATSASLIIPAALFTIRTKSQADSDGDIRILSNGTAIILLILYALYLVFRLRTHASLFDAGHQPASHRSKSGGQQLSLWATGGTLVVVTISIAICAEYLIDSIDSLVETAHISKTFVGLILLPTMENTAEYVTAVDMALKDKMDLAIDVAARSSMQIALLLTPLVVILGWFINQPITLYFEKFETVVFLLSVLVVTYVIQDGKSNYLEGAMASRLFHS